MELPLASSDYLMQVLGPIVLSKPLIGLWLLVLVATFVAAIVLRKRPMAEVAIGLSASGLLYLLPYFFVAPGSDFRYLYWSIVAANLSIVIMGGILMQVTVELLKSRESHARKEAVPEAG